MEGHHFSLQITLVDGQAACQPLFLGANPAEVAGGVHAGLRVLAAEEELARELVLALDEPQLARARLAGAVPADIAYVPAVLKPEPPTGIAIAELRPEQRARLDRLLAEYARNLRGDLAEAELARIAPQLAAARFTWIGALERGQPCYWRVQGASFALEYDNTQNGANHAHTVWRDFEREFGRDLLREHLQREHAR